MNHKLQCSFLPYNKCFVFRSYSLWGLNQIERRKNSNRFTFESDGLNWLSILNFALSSLFLCRLHFPHIRFLHHLPAFHHHHFYPPHTWCLFCFPLDDNGLPTFYYRTLQCSHESLSNTCFGSMVSADFAKRTPAEWSSPARIQSSHRQIQTKPHMLMQQNNAHFLDI